MKISVLGSGSSGNCVFLETGRTRVLVDAGFGIRSLRRRCREAGISIEEFDAILVTHGHSDHIAGIPSLLKSSPAVVFMNEGTREEAYKLRGIDRQELFCSGQPFSIGDLSVEAFPTPHDAAESVGFKFSAEGISGALATDLGEITPTVLKQLEQCDWLVLESNHDEELLKVGPYPWDLKRRVLGPTGHLSNRALAEFISRDFDGRAAHLFLAHLSRKNNDPELALASANTAVEQRPTTNGYHPLQVHLTYQNNPSIVLDL